MTYDPAGEPIDPARGEDIVARAEGIAVVEPPLVRPVARPVPRRTGLSGPVKAVAVGGAGIVTGLVLAAILPKRSRNRVIVAPGLSRKKRKLKTKSTTSLLVDLHLIDRS
ncbi:MAG: hypothetical protein Q7T55_01095 [Solirubrobacteraceae bacterium]|nr:hypothetical protein [Solirubrobacteraceae bacterium]